ncbi:MAG: NAD(P)H-quinone oxidoreductase [Pyrinomonadaceae bacterium]
MKAVYIKEFGGAENLEIRAVENPAKPKGAEVLVNVKASALNRADLLQRMGKYPAPKGFPERILGLEFAGEVAEIGADVTNFKTGDRVFGITAGGAQAEFLLTEESLLAKIPDNLSFTEAAAIPEAFITAHDAIFTNGNLKEHETLLIHAVGSGVGLAALQLAKAKGARVFGTSRTADKLIKANEFGLDNSIITNDSLKLNEGKNPEYFAELIEHFSGGKGADVILDLVGAGYFAANVECLNLKGRIIFVGTTSGAKTELNISQIMAKRAKLIGTVLRSRPTAEKAEATRKFVEEVVPLFESGRIRPVIDRIFKMEEIQKAHEYLESNASFGKVVLEF